MHVAVRYLVSAVLVALVATTLGLRGLVERELADAEEELATLNTNTAARRLDAIYARVQLAERVPWLLGETSRGVETRRAQARYWRGEYATLVAEYPDLGGEDIRDNLLLQLTLAVAHVREANRRAGDEHDARLSALDRSIGTYAQVLRNTRGHRDAAFNYELLVQQRDELAAGGDIPAPQRSSPLGNPGSAGEVDMDMLGDMNDIQIYVPSDMSGRESTDEPTVGGDAPLRRRG